jgi:undecaprenyl-diphosphatase
MTFFDALILGLVQGLTEFLPVSSSGHLTLGESLLGLAADEQPLFFKVWVHAATLGAVTIFYFRDLVELAKQLIKPGSQVAPGSDSSDESSLVAPGLGRPYILFLILATIPAVVAGLTLEDLIEERLDTPFAASCMLIFTGCLLLLSRLKFGASRSLTWQLALVIGIAQAMALPPGVSRSGMTITTALLLGIDRTEAVRFSFLLSIPVIGGALLLMLVKEGLPESLGMVILVGSAVAAFASGYLAIAMVKKFVIAGRFYLFGPYCLLVGAIGIWYFG